jgi:hypothetical protein
MDRDRRVEVKVAPLEAEELPEPCTDSPLAETHRSREHEPVLLSSMRRSDLLRGFEWQANNAFNPEQPQSQVSAISCLQPAVVPWAHGEHNERVE